MEEENQKIIALLSKIEHNTGKLISFMAKGRGAVFGTTGRRMDSAQRTAVSLAGQLATKSAIKAARIKPIRSTGKLPDKSIVAMSTLSNPPTPQALPASMPQTRQAEGAGKGAGKTPSEIASKPSRKKRALPARDEKGRFVRQPQPAEPLRPTAPNRTAKGTKGDAKGTVGTPAGKSQKALDMRRRKKEAQNEQAGMAKVLGKVLKTSSKVALTAAKGFIWSQQMKTGGNALGLTAGGAFWAGMQEVVEAVQTAKDNRILQAISAKFAQRKEKKAVEKKGSAVRDNRGRFIPGAKTAVSAPNAKRRISTFGDAAQKAKIATRNKRLERKGDRQHRELIRAVEGVSGDSSNSALMNFLPRLTGPIAKVGKLVGKVLGLFSKGPVKAIAGAAGVAGSAAAVGGKALSKVPILGRLIPGATKAAAPVAGKVGGKMLGKVGAKAVGKSVLKKIPALGLIAGAGFAISRLAKGDVLGAIAELGSGAVSLVPGIGTAASVAIDAGLVARDLKAQRDKDLKISLKKDSQSDTIPETGSMPAPLKPATVELTQTSGPVSTQPYSVSALTAAFEAALKRALKQQAKETVGQQKQPPYRIPTDFDEPLLVLMAHDRI